VFVNYFTFPFKLLFIRNSKLVNISICVVNVVVFDILLLRIIQYIDLNFETFFFRIVFFCIESRKLYMYFCKFYIFIYYKLVCANNISNNNFIYNRYISNCSCNYISRIRRLDILDIIKFYNLYYKIV